VRGRGSHWNTSQRNIARRIFAFRSRLGGCQWIRRAHVTSSQLGIRGSVRVSLETWRVGALRRIFAGLRRAVDGLCVLFRRAKLLDESGQGMVEYALLLVFITVVVVVSVTVVGAQLSNIFSNVTLSLGP
jgi:Flp pilus assembly pilin Flp